MQRYTVVHKTIYTYEFGAAESYTQIKISPIETFCQSVNNHSIEINPDVPIYPHSDFFGNIAYEFSVPFRHNKLEIIAKSDVTLYMPSKEPMNSSITVREAKQWFSNYELEFYDFLKPSHFTPYSKELAEFSDKILAPERKFSDALQDLNSIFTKEFKYKSGATTINTPIHEVLRKRAGVCQDFSHTMIAALRYAGIAARYVSGYIESYDPKSNVEMIGAEQSHAWVDVYVPEFSWFGMDPTNNMFSSNKHLRVAMGRDFNDVSPVRGTYKGFGRKNLIVDVKMRRVDTTEDTPQDTLQKAS